MKQEMLIFVAIVSAFAIVGTLTADALLASQEASALPSSIGCKQDRGNTGLEKSDGKCDKYLTSPP